MIDLNDKETVLKIKRDAKFFIENFLYIVDKGTELESRKIVPFNLNSIQNKYYENRSRFDLILKSRKPGISSLISAEWLHACLFQDNTRAVVVSHEDEATKRLFERVRFFLDHMETSGIKMEVELDEESKKQLTFPETNSSFWLGTAGSRAFGRGDDITHLHLSEISHYTDQTMVTGVMEACVPGARRVWETTANGIGELFYQKWKETEDDVNKSVWKPHFFAWFDDDTNKRIVPTGFILSEKEKLIKKQYNLSQEQIYWHHCKEKESADKSLMPQEFPSNPREAFLSSGRKLFNAFKLEIMLKHCVDPEYVGELEDTGSDIEFKEFETGNLKIWKMPQRGRQYICPADVSEGVKGGCFCVCHILDRSSYEQVGIWRGHIDPGKFGQVMVDIGYFYNNALILPEMNNHGWATIHEIKALNYPHLVNSSELMIEGIENKDGFPTNQKTLPLILSAARNAIEDLIAKINDKVTINEMLSTIIDDKGKAVPEKGCFMDTVISWAIGIFALKFLAIDEHYSEHNRLHKSDRQFAINNIRYKGRRRTGF